LPDLKLAIEHIEKLISRMHVRLGLHLLGEGDKLGEIGVHMAVGHHVSKALEVVGGGGNSGLRQPHALLAAVNPEDGVGLGLEKIGEVLGKDHGDAGEIAQGRDHTAGFQLGKKAGRKSRVPSQLDQSHRLLQAQPLDSFSNPLFGDKALCGFWIDLRFLRFFAFYRRRIAHASLRS
jgi:hypothetical protein